MTKNRVEMDCIKHFQEVRREIDLHREELKIRIDDVALTMIAETNKYEAAYLERLTKKYKSYYSPLKRDHSKKN